MCKGEKAGSGKAGRGWRQPQAGRMGVGLSAFQVPLSGAGQCDFLLFSLICFEIVIDN